VFSESASAEFSFFYTKRSSSNLYIQTNRELRIRSLEELPGKSQPPSLQVHAVNPDSMVPTIGASGAVAAFSGIFPLRWTQPAERNWAVKIVEG
jgi:hypothetical protein